MRVALILVDGFGIGERDPERNPCAVPNGSMFANFSSSDLQDSLSYGGLVVPLDTTLGVEGIPQSATGQTTLLTGVNAAKLIGTHLYGFPNAALRELLMKESIFKNMRGRGLKASFINAYRPLFFELGERVWEKPLSPTTWAARAGEVRFHTLEDISARRAIYQEHKQNPCGKGSQCPDIHTCRGRRDICRETSK